MNFISYTVDNSKKLNKMKKSKPSFFRRGNKASVFLFNEKDNGIVHVILKLNDEYMIRTRLFEEYTSIPFDHYINVFYNSKNENMFIEESLTAYLDVAVDFLQTENDVSIERKQLSNEIFVELTDQFAGISNITRLEYYDDEIDEDRTLEFVSFSEFSQIAKKNIKIDFMNWRFKDFYASANRNGKIKLDNSNDDFLVKWLEVFSYAL